jgi:hypothetical protein
MGIPTGTVTFLFTDVEGSTRLWEESRDSMTAALARHDAILRQVIESRTGYVFSTGGDAFAAAFQRVSDALGAALAAQVALQDEPWIGVDMRVRMAVHVGEAEERDGDYFGPTLNRTARDLSTAGGKRDPGVECRGHGRRRIASDGCQVDRSRRTATQGHEPYRTRLSPHHTGPGVADIRGTRGHVN